ncbi:hypothetical protein ACH36K_04380 [Clostridium sp. MB05]|jgi:hypothetical protein|uniref:hypothetical protein n=1 Tax=Clostridium sp. MB05 TaxID=3376682 RepID=UPI003981BCD6
MSNKKKSRTDGVIPMKNKTVATPVNHSNVASSSYEYTRKQEVNKTSKTNQLY